MSWSESDIPDLTGRVAVVTGASSGLGLECARALAAHGAVVVAASRNLERCAAAIGGLGKEPYLDRIAPRRLDLADLDSVDRFAEEFSAEYAALDILMNNAGVMATPERLETAQGFELQFGTNHLGHFALTGLLLPALARGRDTRMVTVSSSAHFGGAIDFDDLQRLKGYTPYGAYSQSKLANLLFMLELDRRLRGVGSSTLSVGAHPGLVGTNLQASGPFLGSPRPGSRLILWGARAVGQSSRSGAAPQLYAALAPGVRGGEYFGPRFGLWGGVARARMSPLTRNEEVAHRLWDESVRLTGVDIDAALAAGCVAVPSAGAV